MPELTTAGHIIVLIIEALLGGTIVASYIQLRKLRGEINLTDAQTDKTAAESWEILVRGLSSRVAALENTLKEREEEREKEREEYTQRIDDLEAELEELRAWIMKQGLTPPPRKVRKKA